MKDKECAILGTLSEIYDTSLAKKSYDFLGLATI